MRVSVCRILVVVLAIYTITKPATPQTRALSKQGRPVTVEEKLKQHHIPLTKAALLRALRNSDPEVRGLAATKLAFDQATEAIPRLIEAVTAEKVPKTRVDMAFALAQLGVEQGFMVLTDTCNESDAPAHLRLLAASYLLFTDDNGCLPAVLSILEFNTEADTQMGALSLLPRFKHLSEADSHKIYNLVLKGLADPAVRLVASRTLVELGYSSAIPYLQSAIAAEANEDVPSAMEKDLHRLQQAKDR